MTGGHVRWFNSRKGYGFIVGPEGKDVFVHFSSIDGDGYRALREGDRVEYDLIQTTKGLAASHVKPAERTAAPQPS